MNMNRHAAGGTGRGIPESFDPKLRHPGNQGFDEWYSNGNWFDNDPKHMFHNGKDVGPVKGETSDLVMDKALEFIHNCAGSKKPFLAAIWFPSPHGPNKASGKYRAPYKDRAGADYYGEIAGIDHNKGRMRNELRKLGIADNTLVWFNSDNGGVSRRKECSNGGFSGDKGSLQEGGIRVPGIIDNNYKLVASKEHNQLFDLETDKKERTNISAKHPETTAKLRSALDA